MTDDSSADMVRYGPACDHPVARSAMVHGWDQLTFLHYSFPPAAVQPLLPKGLTVETRQGKAWVSLVPFFLRVGFARVPSVRWLSRFAETNVRTYVRSEDGTSGIWFFSLDAARLGAVLVARATYRLPYFWSRMRIEQQGSSVRYDTRRRWPGPKGATSSIEIEIGERLEMTELTELDHFLTARWALFSAPMTGLRHARASHDPWPLHRAIVRRCEDNLIQAAGLPAPAELPIAHWSPSVEVRIGWPTRVKR